MKIEPATKSDLPAIVSLLSNRRERLSAAEPVFWAKAENAEQMTEAFLGFVLDQAETIALIAKDGDTALGILIAIPFNVPPVYAPPGPTYMIDDFTLADKTLWPDLGPAMIREAEARAKEKGACQLVMVGTIEESERDAPYEAAGFAPVSRWWRKSL